MTRPAKRAMDRRGILPHRAGGPSVGKPNRTTATVAEARAEQLAVENSPSVQQSGFNPGNAGHARSKGSPNIHAAFLITWGFIDSNLPNHVSTKCSAWCGRRVGHVVRRRCSHFQTPISSRLSPTSRRTIAAREGVEEVEQKNDVCGGLLIYTLCGG
jgi:hypothetical protein